MGKIHDAPKGPGVVLLIPFMDNMVKVDLRASTMNVAVADVRTRNDVRVRADAVVSFRVVDPEKSVIEVEDHALATSQVSQAVVHNVIVQTDLNELLDGRQQINNPVCKFRC